eukprot:5072186-Prymnesium_polylepis.1
MPLARGEPARRPRRAPACEPESCESTSTRAGSSVGVCTAGPRIKLPRVCTTRGGMHERERESRTRNFLGSLSCVHRTFIYRAFFDPRQPRGSRPDPRPKSSSAWQAHARAAQAHSRHAQRVRT